MVKEKIKLPVTNYLNTCTVHLLLFLLYPTNGTINTITVYVTTVTLCNLYCYMLRHFPVTIMEFTINFKSYNLRTYIKVKGRFIRLFQHCGRSAYCILTLNKFPHSSPEAPRIIQMRETSTSEGGNYYQ